uniref:RING-type domain-containing protein n=1 Tax=Anopheles atroparvus TaxID=41427 RepID=A0AAG5D9W2_ANOAO
MSLFQELRDLDDVDVVRTTIDIECPICFGEIEAGKGIQLKECLHSFCKECITGFIESSEDVELRCPFITTLYRCEAVIQQREMKALVRKEVYDKMETRAMDRASNIIPNSFHCQTPDCCGWWVYEEKVHLYKCPVCAKVNCTDCKAIHEGLECQVYQDIKNFDNPNEKLSTEHVLKLVQSNQALQCPKCGVAIMKVIGCDGVICSWCKTEICWVTRGPRWGPAGKGDTSGGCRCGVNGKQCHPNCKNCH